MLDELWQSSASARSSVPGAEPQGHQGAAMALLSDLKVMTFCGEDVLTFLQGYFTCDLGGLQQNSYQPTAVTSLKGRVIANGWCHLDNDRQVSWILHHSLTEAVAQFMKPYLAFSRTELQLRHDDHLIIGNLQNPAVPMIMDNATSLEKLLNERPVVGEDDWHRQCVQAHVAIITATTTDRFLPQMLGLVELGAIDFDKGCYLGQEVVARAQHRGQVKRRLKSLNHPSTATFAIGDPVSDSTGSDVGTLVGTSSTNCLAVLQVAATEPFFCGEQALSAPAA